MASKEVTIKLATDVDLSDVDSLESKLKALQNQKLSQKLVVDMSNLEEVNSKIESIQKEMDDIESLAVSVEGDEKLDELKAELEALEQEKIDLEIAVADEQLQLAQSEIEEMDGTEINLQLAMQNFTQGIQIAKQGISELKSNMDEVAQAGMQSEQNKAFLQMNLGAEKARDTYQQISDIVASMPGDDNTMRSVLSTAQALGNNLKPDEMKSASATMADYMSASATMGKMATESQQDIMKYLLDGNTAELERGSIVSSQVDKLKSANTFMERQEAMQKVLNELGYGGLSQQDTMLNKQAEWEGMIYNSQDALSSMWLNAEKGGMDYILQLNESTNGLLGMGIVATEMASGPLVDVVSGVGQVGMALKSLKDLNVVSKVKDLSSSFISLGKSALTSGYNALKAGGMWLVEKAQVVASTIAKGAAAVASWALAAAEWAAASPIVLLIVVIVALGLAIWALYLKSETFRNAVNNLGATMVQIGQTIVNSVVSAYNYVKTVLTQFITSIINFRNNLVNNIVNGAKSAVTGFANAIGGMYNKLKTELSNMLRAVATWASTLPQKFWEAGVNAVKQFLSALGIASPGTMQRTLIWEISEMGNRVPEESQTLLRNVSTLGSEVVDSFGEPSLDVNQSLNTQLSNIPNTTTQTNGGWRDFIVNVYGDIDNDRRVQQIVDVIKRELSFENTTAGRTV